MSGQAPRMRAGVRRKTTRMIQEGREEETTTQEVIEMSIKRKRAISAPQLMEVTKMAAASVSSNLSQDALEEVASQVRVFMEAAQVQAMEEGCNIKSMLLQLVDTLKGMQGNEDRLKALDEKLDSVLDELKTIHKDVAEMKEKMCQLNLSSFLSKNPPNVASCLHPQPIIRETHQVQEESSTGTSQQENTSRSTFLPRPSRVM